MKYDPYKHQQLAYDFCMTHPHCALFISMGLGKTAVTLTVLTERLWNEFSVHKCLVIAPKNVAENTWTKETKKWDHTKPIRVSLVSGTAAQRRAALQADADLYIVGRDNVVWLMEQHGGKLPYEMVVIDELSSFKSHQAKRFKALRKAIQTVPYVIGLTGTPAPNGYLDLWPQIYLLDGGQRLGRSIGQYRDRYFTPGRRKGNVIFEYRLRLGAKAAIDRELSSLCLSMRSEDWIDLPDTIYNVIPVRLPDAGRRAYKRLEEEFVIPLLQKQTGFEQLDPTDPEALRQMTSAIRADMAATLAGKLLQMANGAVYDDEGRAIPIHDVKLDALAELIDTNAGNSLLVFYAYEHDRRRILERFPNARLLKTPQDVEDWNNGEIPLLLCHPASAGHGLNLQEGGHIIVWFGLTWSLELYQQANARLPRPGQKHTVIINHIIALDTIDERVMQVLQSKNATQNALLNALKRYLNEGD